MSERRENQRIKTRGLSTPFGEVMDLSESGIGVFRKGSVACSIGDTVSVYLAHGSYEIDLTAKCVRISRVGLFRHEIGFAFVNIDQATRDEICALMNSAGIELSSPRCWIAA